MPTMSVLASPRKRARFTTRRWRRAASTAKRRRKISRTCARKESSATPCRACPRTATEVRPSNENAGLPPRRSKRRPRFLHSDAPQRARAIEIDQRRSVQQRAVVPYHDVARQVDWGMTVLRARRMALQFVEQRDACAIVHVLDAERGAGDSVERFSSRVGVLAHQGMAHPGHLVFLLPRQLGSGGAALFIEVVAVAVVVAADEAVDPAFLRVGQGLVGHALIGEGG